MTSFHIALCFKKYQRSNIGACLNPLYCSSKKKTNLKKELPVGSSSFTALCLFSHHRRFSDSTASITSTPCLLPNHPPGNYLTLKNWLCLLSFFNHIPYCFFQDYHPPLLSSKAITLQQPLPQPSAYSDAMKQIGIVPKPAAALLSGHWNITRIY